MLLIKSNEILQVNIFQTIFTHNRKKLRPQVKSVKNCKTIYRYGMQVISNAKLIKEKVLKLFKYFRRSTRKK